MLPKCLLLILLASLIEAGEFIICDILKIISHSVDRFILTYAIWLSIFARA